MKYQLPQNPSVKELIDVLAQLPPEADISVVVPGIDGFRIDAVCAMTIPNKIGIGSKTSGTRDVVIIEAVRS